jgi:hypothetical protein
MMITLTATIRMTSMITTTMIVMSILMTVKVMMTMCSRLWPGVLPIILTMDRANTVLLHQFLFFALPGDSVNFALLIVMVGGSWSP